MKMRNTNRHWTCLGRKLDSSRPLSNKTRPDRNSSNKYISWCRPRPVDELQQQRNGVMLIRLIQWVLTSIHLWSCHAMLSQNISSTYPVKGTCLGMVERRVEPKISNCLLGNGSSKKCLGCYWCHCPCKHLVTLLWSLILWQCVVRSINCEVIISNCD